jgi:hypothetical protein
MNKLLLEKIEELTLYTIQQQKEINTTKNLAIRLEMLEHQNREVLKRLDAHAKDKN